MEAGVRMMNMSQTTGDEVPATAPEGRVTHPVVLAARMLLHMRMWGLLFVGAAVLVLVRLPFALLVPQASSALSFDPLFVAVPCLALLAGPAALVAAPLGAACSAFLAGSPALAIVCDTTGAFAAALHVLVLWESSFFRRRSVVSVVCGWNHALRFTALAVTAGLAHASWRALPCEMLGQYPLGYAAVWQGLQVFAFTLPLAPVVYRIAARDISGNLGSWRCILLSGNEKARWHPLALLACPAVATAAWLVAVLAGLDCVWAPPSFGTHAAGGAMEWTLTLLAVHMLLLLT